MGFFAPLLFLWGKRGTHLKEEEKTKFQLLLQQPAPAQGTNRQGLQTWEGAAKKEQRER